MKSLNYKEVRKGYLTFSCVMVVVIIFPLLMCGSLYSTVAHEAEMIESRSRSFDRTFCPAGRTGGWGRFIVHLHVAAQYRPPHQRRGGTGGYKFEKDDSYRQPDRDGRQGCHSV